MSSISPKRNHKFANVPNRRPYGAPALTSLESEDWNLRQLFGVCYGKKTQLFHYSLVLYSRPSRQILSNAFDNSKKTPRTSNEGLSTNAVKILWVIEISWLTQESFGLKPDWVLLRRMLSITNSKIANEFFKNFGAHR